MLIYLLHGNQAEECHCSGVTQECDQVPMFWSQVSASPSVNSPEFSITDRDPTTWLGDNRPWYDTDSGALTYNYLPGDQTIFFWSLPKIFKGDKLNSYGGNVTLDQTRITSGRGEPIKSSTAILTGNRFTLHYIRDQDNEGPTHIQLTEKEGI